MTADIYRQAQDLVFARYHKDLDDDCRPQKWRIQAIIDHRTGVKKHESVMHQYVIDIEEAVDKLVKNTPKVVTVATKDVTEVSTEPVKPTTPR